MEGKKIGKWGNLIIRSGLFAVIYIGIYVISLLVEYPIMDALGIIRIGSVAMISKLAEESLYHVVKQSILQIEPMKKVSG